MVEYDYQKLWREIGEMQSWQIVSLAAACVEKVFPIIHYLALPETVAFAERCIEFTWSCATSENFDISGAASLREAFNSLAELQCEYPDGLPFTVTRSLSFYDFAISAVNSAANSREAAKNVGISLLVETAELFDLALKDRIDSKIAELGIQVLEKSSQQWFVATLQEQERPAQQTTEGLRVQAKRIAGLFEIALPTYAYHVVRGLVRGEAIRRGESA